MKRTFRIKVITITIILIAIIVGLMSYFIKENANKYEISKVERYNYFVLKQNNLSGVIDRNSNIVIKSEYDEVIIPNPEMGIFVCYKEDDVKILNEKQEVIFSEYEMVEPIRLKNIASDLMYEKSVLTYMENGKYGLISFEGKKITKPIYDSIEGLPYKEGELLVTQGEKYGVINIKGNNIIDIEYNKIEVDGYYVSENGYKYAGYIVSNTTEEGYRYGYINYKGKEIVKTQYNELKRISEIKDNENIYLIYAKNGQFGVNRNGEELITNKYQSISYDVNNKLLVLEKSQKYGIAKLNGEIIVPIMYNQINIVGLYLYAENEQGITVYNSNGTEANIDTNIAIINTENEKYRIRINNTNGTKYGVIGKEGQQIIEEKYNYIEYLYDNYFIVSQENSKLGVVDNKDNIKIQIENDLLQKVGDTSLIQTLSAQEQITNLYSKDMIKICEMKNATIKVEENYIKIYNEEEMKYFSKEGKELNNIEVYTKNKLFAKKENGKWGFVDNANNVVVDYKYDNVTEFNEYGYAGVKKDGKWGSINEQGNEVAEPIYKMQEQNTPSFIGKYYKVEYGFGEFYYSDNKS